MDENETDFSRQSSTATQLSQLSDTAPLIRTGQFWKQFFKEQFHYTKFCTCHRDWRLFVHTPWLPQKWNYQLIYIIYRIAIALYFICWFIASAIIADKLHDTKVPIYITYWSFILLTIYLIYSAIVTVSRFVYEHFFKKNKCDRLLLSDLQDPPFISGYCCSCNGRQNNNNNNNNASISWYLQIQWILFVVTTESSVLICIVYWSIFDGTVYSWPVNLHEHLFVLFPGLIDLFITGIPIRFYQFIYLMIFNSVYVIFTGIYYGAGGTNTKGKPYVYSTFNYKDQPTFSSFAAIFIAVIVPLLLHMMYWGLYLLRTWFLTLLFKKRNSDLLNSIPNNDNKQPV